MDGLECKILLKWMMRRYHFRTHPYMHTPPVLWCLQLMGKSPFFHLRHQGGEDPALTNHGHLRTDVCFFSIELMPCLQNRPQKSKAAGMKIYLSADIHSKFGPLWCSVGFWIAGKSPKYRWARSQMNIKDVGEMYVPRMFLNDDCDWMLQELVGSQVCSGMWG
jgi:hypothetical protein